MFYGNVSCGILVLEGNNPSILYVNQYLIFETAELQSREHLNDANFINERNLKLTCPNSPVTKSFTTAAAVFGLARATANFVITA
jgi:hypothetical protein